MLGGLCEEREWYSVPSGVSEVSPHDEGDQSQVVGVDGLDGEEEMIAPKALQIVDG